MTFFDELEIRTADQRVSDLEKLLNDTGIDLVYRNEAMREVILKLKILINGAKKRKKYAYVESMLQKKLYWEETLLCETDG